MRASSRICAALSAITLAALPSMVAAGEKVAKEKRSCDQTADVCVTQMMEKIRRKGWVGIELDWNDHKGPPTITKVVEGSPAEAFGLQPGDVLLKMNGLGYDGDNTQEVKRAYKALEPGDSIVYTVRRGDGELEIEVTLGRVPDHVAAQWVGSHVMHYHTHADAETETTADRDGD